MTAVEFYLRKGAKKLDYQEVNEYLTAIFNNVLVIEEASLRGSQFKDVSIKEVHTIDVIGTKGQTTPSEVARELMVTLGTVTASLNNLERKGYIERTRSEKDRRVVHLSLTSKGRLVYRLHRRFHRRMVTQITDGMTEQEFDIMSNGLKKLHQFLEDLK